MNNLQKLYEALKFVYQLIIIFVKKLVSSLESPITFDERFKVTSVPIFVPDFSLLSCELDNFTFKVLYLVPLY